MEEYLIISNANFLLRVAPEQIAYVCSEGSYCTLRLTNGDEYTFSFNLVVFEKKIVEQLAETAHFFARVGRNYIINDANHPLQGKQVAYHDQTYQKTDGLTHNCRLGLNYAFADNHQLSLAYTGKWDSSVSHHETMGTGTSQQHGNEHIYLHNIDASYALPFGLQVGASYLYYKNPRQQNLVGTMLDEERNLYTNSKQVIDKWLFTADQSHSLKHGWELSYGIKFQKSDNRSYQTTINKDGAEVPDATSEVNIEERILSVYGGISKQINERISLEASIEAEQYHSPQWNKWHIYPTLSTMWKANPSNILNLSFSSNSKFPSYWSTMSSIYYASNYMEIWGNQKVERKCFCRWNLQT